jgi:high-affinity iron transporter
MKRPLPVLLVVLLLHVPAASGVAAPAPGTGQGGDIQRVLTLLNVAGEEYREGLIDGRVVQPIEYEEAGMFLEEAERRLAAAGVDAPELVAALASLRRAWLEKGPLVQVRAQIDALRAAISAATGVVEEVFPARAPSAERGRALFEENCTSCHGEKADGRGSNAADLTPPPANFTDAPFMRKETPFDFFHVVSVGKPATAMPAWADVLSLQDRWDLVSFLYTVEPGNKGLAEGQGIYLSDCAGCHGASGDGKGALSASLLTPAPALSSVEALARRSSSDLFATVTHGVSGTAMPAFGRRLSKEEIWSAVSFLRFLSLGGGQAARPDTEDGGGGRRFAGLLRLLAEEYGRAVPAGAPRNELELTESMMLLQQVRLRSGAVLAALEAQHAPDAAGRVEELLVQIGASIEQGSASQPVAVLAAQAAAAIEQHLPAPAPEVDENDALSATARLLDDALDAYRAGDSRAVYLVSDAYFQFEPLETELAAREREITRRVESHFIELRGVLAKPGSIERAAAVVAQIKVELQAARVALAPTGGAWPLAVQSATIILREGFEVVLIIGALLAYVRKSGNLGMRRPILLGTAAGVVFSLASAYVLVELLRASGAAGDVLEGIAMLLATGVLFFVSYWLISKAEADKWQRYIQGKVKGALARGSAAALAGAAFLAVYREGVETVLFYQALAASSAGSLHAVAGGFAAGLLLLGVLYAAFMRLGMRIPLRQFFLGTSFLLYYLAFVFAGKGIRELQEAGVVGVTAVGGVPSIDLLGIYPTLETLFIQGILLVCLGYAITVTLRARRRQRLLGQVTELRTLAVELREELSRASGAGTGTSQRLETFIERAVELEARMSLRLSGHGGAKA